jgi:hypothetical protein
MSAPDALSIPVHHDSINDAYTTNITTLAPLNPLGLNADHWQSSSYPVGGGLGPNMNPFPTPTESSPFYHHQQLQQMQMQPIHSNGHESPHHLIPALQQVVTTMSSSSSSILSNGAGVHVDENGDITVNPINPNEGAESETREEQEATERSPPTESEQDVVDMKPATSVIISAPTPPPQTAVVSA